MLDRDRPYGHVFGEPGVTYEQDGKFYDAQGREVELAEPAGEDTKPRRGRPPKDAA